ncbi:hypothetical protein RUND412_000031 [Rhizina undulata]
MKTTSNVRNADATESALASSKPAREKSTDEDTDGKYVPLKTYNVTKADAQPVVSEHHKITFDERKVLVPWEEGKTSYFHHIWLRDHCQCPECFHPETRQRLLDTFSIPKNLRPKKVEGSEKGLQIEWKNDGHKSLFSWEWLHLHSYNPRLEKYISPQLKVWGAEIEKNPPEVDYEFVMESERGVAKWTSKIYQYGFCYVNGVPVTPEATEMLVKRISFIRRTHYGAFWDFTSDLSKKDTAYTTLALGVHTDTTYFSEPTGLQLFHLLEHSGAGGQTTLVDGFRAAKILREQEPNAYRMLSETRIPAHSSGNDGVSIQPYAPFPVFNHHPVNGELFQVRWNNDDRATMDRWNDADEVERFYDAGRAWNEILRRPENEYREQLVPGRALIFDNWRVLHGRTAFDGVRRMCGAYINRDDFISRYLMTNSKRGDVLRAL